MALLMMLRRMRQDEITAHGFHSTFSDWASEVSSFSRELRQTALAHTIQNKAERAYRRSDARKAAGNDGGWANWCVPGPEPDDGSEGVRRTDA
jgi:integrase